MELNHPVKNTELERQLFNIANSEQFNEVALEVFRFQFNHNPVYQQFCQLTQRTPEQVRQREQIPFLPVRFFKTHRVVVDAGTPELVFESSGTTGSVNSQHLVLSADLYRKSLLASFERCFGPPSKWCLLGLLPSYLERPNASLVWMVQALMDASQHPLQGFFLESRGQLLQRIHQLEALHQPTLLFGVTFALLDLAQTVEAPLASVQILETGGMKGRGRELIREELHQKLQAAFGPKPIWSEYGMTEMLSQAYASGSDGFEGPPWMKLLLRESDDPFALVEQTDSAATGAVNVIDLANLYSCSFLATDDIGRLLPNGRMQILGRLDYSDMRGCSLLTA